MARNRVEQVTEAGTLPKAKSVSFLLPDSTEQHRRSPPARRKANTLLFLTSKTGPKILQELSRNLDLKIRVISDFDNQWHTFLDDEDDHYREIEWFQNQSDDTHHNLAQLQGHQLAGWADLLFVMTDANLASSMIAGLSSNTILHVLRCWDTSKRIIMVPEMTMAQWKHPIWKKQQRKLEQNWDWVQVLRPALWDYTPQNYQNPDMDVSCFALAWKWDGPEELIEAIQDEAHSVVRTSHRNDLRKLSPQSSHHSALQNANTKPRPKLPSEIWTIILDFYGDWEFATALGIYTHLAVPSEWVPHVPRPGRPSRSLEYTILTASMPQIRTALSQSSLTLSTLATKLIFKFSLTPILTYLASHQKDIFWTSFGLALLPHKASLIYNSPKILEWWRTCPAVLKKEYGTEALDGASRAGFVQVLDWWLGSGLRLSYTERALESASAKGHIDVLEWWKKANAQKGEAELPLKVGKSILAAAQSGRVDVVQWWDASGIAYSHEDGVARLASAQGHVDVLTLWRELKGNKMIFDNQVLVGATKNGHARVLEWWKKSGLSVEYKTCDIEEAMEDAVGGGGESEVREWWSRNGLNLGVGTGEWMKVKTL